MTELAHPADAWQPQQGPQMVFAQTSADVAIIGGSPGGGKSVVSIYEGAKLCHLRGARRVRAPYFRRDETSLKRAGSIWDRATEMLPAFGGTVRLDALSVTIEHPDGQIEDQHRLDFRHLHRVGDERSYDGSEQDLIVFEELQEFAESQFFYMVSRLRTRSGLRPRIRASCNADPECEWLVDLLLGGGYLGDDGYILKSMSGVVRFFARDAETDELLWYDDRESALEAHPELLAEDVLSFTFVLSTPGDNPALMRRDRGYMGRLRLQARKDRVRLIGEGPGDRGGCWFTTDKAGDFFALDAFKLVDGPPSPIVRRVRGWDFGSSEPTTKEPDPDTTAGARVALCENGELYIEDLVERHVGPLAGTALVIDTAALDGPLVEVAIFQDTGAAGKRDAHTIKAELEKHRLTVEIVHSDRRQNDEKGSVDVAVTRARKGRRTKSSPAKQALARPWSLLASQGRVYMRIDRSGSKENWNKRVIHLAHRFPNAKKDDPIDAISCAVQVLTDGGTTVSDALEQRERAERRAAPPPRPAGDRPQYDGIEIINLEDT